jgi:hypothetical protein
VHSARVLDAMIRAPLAASALAVLAEALELRWAFTERIAREVMSEKWRPAHMATAFVLYQTTAMADYHEPGGPAHPLTHPERQVLDRLGKSLSNFLVRTSSLRLEAVNKQIELLEEPWPARWVEYLRSVRPRGAIGRIVRRDS